MAESDVVAEIERNFVLPGQATAYKVCMMKILEEQVVQYIEGINESEFP